MKIQLITVGLMLLLLYVISEAVPTWEKVQKDSEVAQIKDPIICAQQGGTIKRVCRSGIQMCVVQFQDAGKSCTDSSECQGACMSVRNDARLGDSVKGACASSSEPCGLFLPLKGGKVAARMWAD